MADSNTRDSICLHSNGSDSESDSEIEMDKEYFIGTLPSTTETLIQDMKMDPRLEVSDHDSDQELSMHGYGSCDTDATDEDETSHVESRLVSKYWCSCGNCEVMDSEIESYCCQESTIIDDIILSVEKLTCVVDCELFKSTISNQAVLELCSFGMLQKKMAVDEEGKILPEGLRYAGYRNFLNICRLRFIGKNRRYALPACVVMKIRSLYPSKTGKYKSFKSSEFSSRI